LALSVAPEASLTMAPYINMVIAAIVLYAGLHVIQTDAADRNKLESELRNGLLRREFLLNYQPQVATGTRLVGAEVLIRWEHPKLGLIPPSEFIPLAERSGLMGQLGDWVLQGACQQLAHWARQHATAQCSLPMPTLLRMCWVLSSRQRLIQRA
jgi:EAL domain-containing protein (putative c-di-GMP-specific phosphodiesterase class I)